MTALPPLYVEIQADIDKLKSGLAAAQKAIKDMETTTEKATTKMTGFFDNMKTMAVGLAAAYAANELKQFVGDSIQAASSFNEALSKATVVFGENAAAIEVWSQTAAESLGMSQSQALAAAGTYGNLFQAFGIGRDKATEMSTTLVQLATDLASFNDSSPDEALNALRSGLSGETEPLKRFGVALNEASLNQKALELGLITTTSGPLPAAAKAQAAYALVMEQTSLAQGDFARTADGVANKQRSLNGRIGDTKQALGELLLPAYNLVLDAMDKMISATQSLIGWIKQNRDAIAAFVAVIGAATVAWGLYWVVQNRAMIGFKTFLALQTLMNAVMAANPIMLVVAALALLAAGFVYAWNNSETFRKVVIEVAKAGVNVLAFLIEAIGGVAEAFLKVTTGGLRLFLMALDAVGVSAAGDALDFINNGISTVGDFFDSAADSVRGWTKSIDGWKDKTISFFGDTSEAATDAKDVNTEALNSTAAAATASGDAQAAASEKAGKAAKKQAETVKEANDRIEGAWLASMRAAKAAAAAAVEAMKTMLAAAQAAIQEAGDKVKEAEQNLQEVLDKAKANFQDAVKDWGEKLFSLADAARDAGDETGMTFMERLNKQVSDAAAFSAKVKQLIQMGLSQAGIDEIMKSGVGLGTQIADEILAGGQLAVAQVNDLYSQIEGISATFVDTSADDAKILEAQAALMAAESAAEKARIEQQFLILQGMISGVISTSPYGYVATWQDVMSNAPDLIEQFGLEKYDPHLGVFGAGVDMSGATSVTVPSQFGNIVYTMDNILSTPYGEVEPNPLNPNNPQYVNNYNLYMENNNTASPEAIAEATIFAIQYGQPVQAGA